MSVGTSIADTVSYCGLTAAFRSSAGKQQRGPISKQRNAWLQTVLIEAAKLALPWSPELASLHARQLEHGHANRATLASGAKTRGLLVGCGQERPALSAVHPACTTHQRDCRREADSSLRSIILKRATPYAYAENPPAHTRLPDATQAA